jgi:glutamine---fructose-6-phosphate transaminase (isomerizing)
MTHFLRDTLRQPEELERTLDHLRGNASHAIGVAAAAIGSARHVYLTGIGSSWHAALAAGAHFHASGHPVHLIDASELLHFSAIPEGSVLIVISRTGRSAEIVGLLPKARASRASVIGITNAPDGPLALESQIPIVIPVAFDHAISVNTYSTLALTAAGLVSVVAGSFDSGLVSALRSALTATARALPEWQQRIAASGWLSPLSVYYFLARGASLSSCNEARLLWEEGAKSPATAMGTGAFRHGPQEIVDKGMRFAIWIDGRSTREGDLAVARDLRQLGASVMLIGQQLPRDAGDLILELPAIPAEWQFLIDIVPAQLAAERLARMSGVDCDTFRICTYIVEDEHGLLREKAGMAAGVDADKDRTDPAKEV